MTVQSRCLLKIPGPRRQIREDCNAWCTPRQRQCRNTHMLSALCAKTSLHRQTSPCDQHCAVIHALAPGHLAFPQLFESQGGYSKTLLRTHSCWPPEAEGQPFAHPHRVLRLCTQSTASAPCPAGQAQTGDPWSGLPRSACAELPASAYASLILFPFVAGWATPWIRLRLTAYIKSNRR